MMSVGTLFDRYLYSTGTYILEFLSNGVRGYFIRQVLVFDGYLYSTGTYILEFLSNGARGYLYSMVTYILPSLWYINRKHQS